VRTTRAPRFTLGCLVGFVLLIFLVFCVVSAHDASTKVHPRLFDGIRVAHLFSFL
jgi:hypothetical protein